MSASTIPFEDRNGRIIKIPSNWTIKDAMKAGFTNFRLVKSQINRAIAEACGYTDLYVTAPDRGSLTERVWGKINGLNRQVPNYHGDLNAMAEAVSSLACHDHRRDFARQLQKIVCGMAAPDPHEDDFYCYNATAAQRAEAFLRTLGKWEDGK